MLDQPRELEIQQGAPAKLKKLKMMGSETTKSDPYAEDHVP